MLRLFEFAKNATSNAQRVVEECDETLFWHDYLIRIDLLDIARRKEIFTEVEQLVRLFKAIESKNVKVKKWAVSAIETAHFFIV